MLLPRQRLCLRSAGSAFLWRCGDSRLSATSSSQGYKMLGLKRGYTSASTTSCTNCYQTIDYGFYCQNTALKLIYDDGSSVRSNIEGTSSYASYDTLGLRFNSAGSKIQVGT